MRESPMFQKFGCLNNFINKMKKNNNNILWDFLKPFIQGQQINEFAC